MNLDSTAPDQGDPIIEKKKGEGPELLLFDLEDHHDSVSNGVSGSNMSNGGGNSPADDLSETDEVADNGGQSDTLPPSTVEKQLKQASLIVCHNLNDNLLGPFFLPGFFVH